MKKLLITGGIGCGKSAVAALLVKQMGPSMEMFSSDLAVKEELKKGAVLEKLAEALGARVRSSEGEVDRDWIRNQILPVPELRKKLEAILHPLVIKALDASCSQAARTGSNLFLAEVPLHYEIGGTVSADFVIVVASSRSVQVRRMMETRGLDEQTVHQFLAAQWPIEAKVERADAVIWNDGSLASLEAQVLTLASPLLQA